MCKVLPCPLPSRGAADVPRTTRVGARGCRWSDRGAIVLEDSLGLQVTEDPSQADFILAHGTEAVGRAAPGAHPPPHSLFHIPLVTDKPPPASIAARLAGI